MGRRVVSRPALGAAAVLTTGALLHRAVLDAFVAQPARPVPRARVALAAKDVEVSTGDGVWTDMNDPYQAQNADMDQFREDAEKSMFRDMMPKRAQREALDREVQVTDMRDINELLKLPNPLRPTVEMQLVGVTDYQGNYIAWPKVEALKRLKPSKLRPVTFHWKDKTEKQTKAPRQYDEIIQRLLNSGPADMEDLVRANWQQFDKAFFFRLNELKMDSNDLRLKEKISNLEKLALDVIKAAQEQTRRTLPQQAEDAREILDAMLEEDNETFLWPPPPAAYNRVAKEITLRAVRNKYEDGWFEGVITLCERFGTKMEVQDKKPLVGMAQIAMQRLTTEWLRNDALWEETDEGKFIFRLMNLSHEQWANQLFLEQNPLDTLKLRDELKIISENKVMALPMGSKLQVYAAKYLQGLVEFIEQKDDLLKQREPTA
jgi:hypothetical protein